MSINEQDVAFEQHIQEKHRHIEFLDTLDDLRFVACETKEVETNIDFNLNQVSTP